MTTVPNSPEAETTSPPAGRPSKIVSRDGRAITPLTIVALMVGILGLCAAGIFLLQSQSAKASADQEALAAAEASAKLVAANDANDAFMTALTKFASSSADTVPVSDLIGEMETAAGNMTDKAAQTQLFLTLGQLHKGRGEYREASRLARRALSNVEGDGADPDELLKIRAELAFAQLLAGDIPEGQELCDTLLVEAEQRLGITDPLYLALLNARANADFMRGELDEGLVIARRALKGREDRVEQEDPNLLFALYSLALVKAADGDVADAIPLAERVNKLWENQNPNHIGAMAAKNTLATLYGRQTGKRRQSVEAMGRVVTQMEDQRGLNDEGTLQLTGEYMRALVATKLFEKAIQKGEPAVEASRTALGPDHPVTVTLMNGLALAYHFSGRQKEAYPLLEVVQEVTAKQQGKESDAYLQVVFDLAVIQYEAGDYAAALKTATEAHSLFEAQKGADDRRTQVLTFALAEISAKNQLYAEAAELYEANYRWRLATMDPIDKETIGCGNNAGMQYRLAHQPEKSIEVLSSVVEQSAALLGADDPATIMTNLSLARTMKDAGRIQDAARLSTTVLQDSIRLLGEENGISCDARACQAEVLMKQGRFAEAESMARDLFGVMKDSPLANNLRLALSANMIAEAQLRQGNSLGAKQLLGAISGSLNDEHPMHTLTAATNILLGEALLAEGDAMSAEEPLLKGNNSLQAVRDKLSVDDAQRLQQSNELLVQLYESTGNAERADEFRSR